MANSSKYNFPNAQKVQIFEQVDTYVDTYIENNGNQISNPFENSSAANSSENTHPANTALTLFYSYSHKDEALRDRLNTHLALLQRLSIIAAWHEHSVERSLRDITAGTDWANAIDTHLNTADIILLLISADFLASDYCYEKEMMRAIARHENQEARVIPIILRPCDWTSAPFGKLQALPIVHGAGAKAVTTWSNQDEAFSAFSAKRNSVGTAQGIRKAAREIQEKKSQS